jgi:hypothetical protein
MRTERVVSDLVEMAKETSAGRGVVTDGQYCYNSYYFCSIVFLLYCLFIIRLT